MKKTISIVTAAAIFCCMPFPVLHGHALSGTGGPNVTWTYENGKLTLSGSGSTMDLAERFYLEVDASFHILNDPWEDFRGEIREIVVEDGITDIGQMLFADTVSLETITLPDSVTVFDSYAFFHTGILRVNCPKHLKYIGNDCFRESKLRFAELPDGLEAIGANCYAGCQQLIAVTMQDSVKRIGKAAFSSCPTFSRIRLSQTLTELPDNCFYGCERLKEVTMPEACTTLGKNCFAGCASMQMLRLPPGIRTIGSRAFGQCIALQQLDLPDGLTTISENMLSECKSIQSLTVPESVTCIERGAFERCQFETLRLPSHRQLAIAEDALPEAWLNRQTGFVILGDGMLFHYGGNDAEVTLPDSVKTLMPNFLGQSEVRKLTLGQHTAEIRNDAFASNTLETVVIPSENVKFDPKAADGAKKLTTFFGKRYSPVHSFAVQNGYRFTATDAEQPHHNTQEIYGSMNLPFGNSGEVFGDCISITPYQEALLFDAADTGTIRMDISQKQGSWSGSCYGLSVVTILVHAGVLPVSVLDPDARTLSEVRPTEQAVHVINYYYLTQCLRNITRKDEGASDLTQFDRIGRAVRYAEGVNQGGNPFLLQIVQENGAHAVVGYGVEDGDWTWNGSRYSRRIRIWDSNYAALEDSICLYFDPETLYWVLPAYGISYQNDPAKDSGGIISVIRDLRIMNACPYDPSQEIAGNTDGMDGLNVADAVLLLRWLSEDEAAPAITYAGSYLGDLDKNGVLDLNDAAALMRLLAAG